MIAVLVLCRRVRVRLQRQLLLLLPWSYKISSEVDRHRLLLRFCSIHTLVEISRSVLLLLLHTNDADCANKRRSRIPTLLFDTGAL